MAILFKPKSVPTRTHTNANQGTVRLILVIIICIYKFGLFYLEPSVQHKNNFGKIDFGQIKSYA